MLEIIATNTYNTLKLAPEQVKFISSEDKIKAALTDENCYGFYALQDNLTVGFALLREFEKESIFLWDFIIDFEYQGKGIGKKFLTELIKILKDKHHAKMITTTYIFGNEVAKNLYEKAGFIQTDIVNDGLVHEVNMKLTITLETERLLLRKWQLSDLDDFYEIHKNPDVGFMTGWKPHESKDESLNILKLFIDRNEDFAIVLKETGNAIGNIGVSADNNRGKYFAKCINYVLSADYWSKGYMTEAVKRMMKYLFEELKIDLLTIFFYPQNVRSKRVIEKCGLEYETTFEKARTSYDGQVYDTVVYSMFREDYEKKYENT